MNLTRCKNGHFYDSEQYNSCPHCEGSGTEPGVTKPITQQKAPEVNVNPEIKDVPTEPRTNQDNSPTIGHFKKSMGTNPVAGWLICTEGKNKGKDYRLQAGKNFIGRDNSMDVVIDGDASVSRFKHATVLYDPKGNLFLVQPGESKELSYLNDEVVLESKVLKAYDAITVGETKLLFVPFCSETFKWNED